MGQRKLILYGTETSPTCQTVLLTLKALDLCYELRLVQPVKGEHLTEDYMKKNPGHTIPTLEDDGLFFGDSHAIITYLVGKYAKDDKLYPKDLVRRARVDQLLHFDNAELFVKCVQRSYRPLIIGKASDVPANMNEDILEAYNMLQRFLGNKRYVADNDMTLADFCCFTSVISLQLILPLTEECHPILHAWYVRMRELPIVEEVFFNDNVLKVIHHLQKKRSKL